MISSRISAAVAHALRDVSDPELRQAVVGLFDAAKDRVENGNVDLVVLCARRLPCLYQVLLDAGYPPIHNAVVVSDRYLDLAGDWAPWRWSHVLILDDSVVLGTTLSKLHTEIQGRVDDLGVAGTVEAMAICVDTERRATYLLDRLNFTAQLERTSRQVQRFSTETVTCLYRNGVPFFSDFPVSRHFEMAPEGLFRFFGNGNWQVADVTAPVVGDASRTAYSLIPNEAFERSMLAQLPMELAQLVHSFKLRFFVGIADTGMLSVTVVPLALLGACEYDKLEITLVNILREARCFASFSMYSEVTRLTPVAMHRLLQMITSFLILDRVAQRQELTPLSKYATSSDRLNPASMELYFGRETDEMMVLLDAIRQIPGGGDDVAQWSLESRGRIRSAYAASLLDFDEVRELLWAQRELLADARPDGAPDRAQMTKVGLVASHAISSLFGFISKEFEEPQQTEIRNLGSYESYLDQFVNQPGHRVLDLAFTMDDLAGALLGTQEASVPWDRALVSLGVDVGNDLGIVVPATQDDPDRKLVYRGYRLGETAQLADVPLNRWNPSEDGSGLDSFIAAVRTGYPLKSTNVRLSLSAALDGKAEEQDGSASLRELVKFVKDSLPGRVVDYFEGVVLADPDEGGRFDVEVKSRRTFATSLSYFRLEQVLKEQQPSVKRGATLRWTVFEIDRAKAKDRISRLYVNASPSFTENYIAETEQRFAFLADSE